ncbi:MAG: hypothetical protein ABDH91_07075 [Bacteroidia bacterium]
MASVWEVLLYSVLLLAFQGALAPALQVPGWAWPMPYVLFWLFLPFSWRWEWEIGAAVLFGGVLDVLFPPIGLQTFCGLWVWGLRRFWLRLLHPSLMGDEARAFAPQRLSTLDFFLYAMPLTLWHHLWYFPLAEWRLHLGTLGRALLSSTYSFVWEWIIFELFLKRPHVTRGSPR